VGFKLFVGEYQLETTDPSFAICSSGSDFGVGVGPPGFKFCDVLIPGFRFILLHIQHLVDWIDGGGHGFSVQ